MIEIAPRPPVPAYPGYHRLTAEIRTAAGTEELSLLLPEDTGPRSEDWLVVPGLMLGMVAGQDVRIRGRASPRLLGAQDELQRIFLKNHANLAGLVPEHPGLRATRVEADTVEPTPPPAEGLTVSAFSGGLDSFSTALTYENEGPVDGLLYVHGYEAKADDERLLYMLLPSVKAAAAHMGKRLFLVEGNFWPVILDRFMRNTHSSLAILTMIGHAMGSHVGRLVVPASYDEAHERDDWASMSALAPLLGSEGLEVEQHGVVTRTEKVRRIAGSEVARRWLHVCWRQDGRVFNCGRCHKCVRTMVNLELAGVLDRFDSFPSHLDLELVENMRTDVPEYSEFVRENLDEAEAVGRPDIAQALRTALARRNPREKRPSGMQRVRKRLERSLYNRRMARKIARHRLRHTGDHLFNTLEAAQVD